MKWCREDCRKINEKNIAADCPLVSWKDWGSPFWNDFNYSRTTCNRTHCGVYGWIMLAGFLTGIIGAWLYNFTARKIGGFSGASVTNNGDGTATFRIRNVAGTHSFFYHIIPDLPGKTGPMHNVEQIFEWTEPIDSNRLQNN